MKKMKNFDAMLFSMTDFAAIPGKENKNRLSTIDETKMDETDRSDIDKSRMLKNEVSSCRLVTKESEELNLTVKEDFSNISALSEMSESKTSFNDSITTYTKSEKRNDMGVHNLNGRKEVTRKKEDIDVNRSRDMSEHHWNEINSSMF